MKTIFNTYIEVESQKQADRLKQVCIDNGLPYWSYIYAFKVLNYEITPCFAFYDGEFYVFDINNLDENDECFNYAKVTEHEWMELLTKHKEEQCKKTID